MNLIDDIIFYISSFLCVRSSFDLYRMTCVCRQFHRVINKNLILWNKMLRLTRRSSIQPLMSVSIDDIKEFILLDSQEFTMRMELMTYTSESLYIYRRLIAYNELDYTKVIIPRFQDSREKWCNNRLKKYKTMVKKMNRLCKKFKNDLPIQLA